MNSINALHLWCLNYGLRATSGPWKPLPSLHYEATEAQFHRLAIVLLRLCGPLRVENSCDPQTEKGLCITTQQRQTQLNRNDYNLLSTFVTRQWKFKKKMSEDYCSTYLSLSETGIPVFCDISRCWSRSSPEPTDGGSFGTGIQGNHWQGMLI